MRFKNIFFSFFNFKKVKGFPNIDSEKLGEIFTNYQNYQKKEDIIFFKNLNLFGAFKYEVIKDILNNSEIGVSPVHLALNNIYFSENESVHQINKKSAIKHLSFLSKKNKDNNLNFLTYLCDIFFKNLNQKTNEELVSKFVCPVVFINALHEFDLLEVLPEFNPVNEKFQIADIISTINLYFEDSDFLGALLNERLDDIYLKSKTMHDLLDEMNDITETRREDLLSFYKSMIFSAVESTISFVSSLVFVSFTKYQNLLKSDDFNKDFYWLANEVLRVHTPVPFVFRSVKKDILISSVQLKKDDIIVLFLGAANLDADNFTNPTNYEEKRALNHLSFGKGHYTCIGQSASYSIAINILQYLSKFREEFIFIDSSPVFYIKNSMQKLKLNIKFNE